MSCSPLPNPTDAGELVAVTSGTGGGFNFLRTVLCAGTNTLTIAVPSNTYATCTANCGTAYLVTPLIGFGVQGTSFPYEPVKNGSSQSFGTRLVNLVFDLQGWPGAVAAQNLNGGEQSGMDTIYCLHPSMGCVQVGPGAQESGPYNNIYVQTQNSFLSFVGPGTFGIYNGAPGAGFHRFTMTSNSSVPLANHPTAAIYNDGPNAVFDGEPHNEGTVDTIDLAPNASVAGVRVNGVVGPPNGTGGIGGNPGTNLVHILNDGYKVYGSTISNLTQQFGSPNGSTNAVADDVNGPNDVTDQFLSRYEFDFNGNAFSSAISQSNASVPTLNGSGYTGGLTDTGNLNFKTSGGGTIALSPGSTASPITINLPAFAGTVATSGTTPIAESSSGAISLQNSSGGNVTSALGTDTAYFTAAGPISTAGDMIVGDSTGGIKDSGTAMPAGCTSGCNFVLGGAGVVPPFQIALSAGHGVNLPNKTYVISFYNDVTRKVGNGYVYVGTASSGVASEALYDSAGNQKWTTGSISTGTAGSVAFTPSSFTMTPGFYYLAYCASSSTPVLTALVDIGGTANPVSSFMASSSVAHTWGTSTDACVSGVVPSSLTPGNITNATSNIEIAAVMITN